MGICTGYILGTPRGGEGRGYREGERERDDSMPKSSFHLTSPLPDQTKPNQTHSKHTLDSRL